MQKRSVIVRPAAAPLVAPAGEIERPVYESTSSASGMHRVEHIMGMPIVIDVRDPGVEPEALERAFAWLRFVDDTFSTYKDDSEISRLNRGELALADAHPEVRTVLERCERLREETGGFFDIRATGERPGAVDPSGLVKGWSVDRAARILEVAGAHNYCVNAGGDIRARGAALPAPTWRIGIQHPIMRKRLAAVIETNDLAVATSGAYERGAHIVDPHSGRPPLGVLSVTVTGADVGTVDAYATAAYAMGPAGARWLARLSGFESMTILDDQTVLSTMGFPAVRDEPA